MGQKLILISIATLAGIVAVNIGFSACSESRCTLAGSLSWFFSNLVFVPLLVNNLFHSISKDPLLVSIIVSFLAVILLASLVHFLNKSSNKQLQEQSIKVSSPLKIAIYTILIAIAAVSFYWWLQLISTGFGR